MTTTTQTHAPAHAPAHAFADAALISVTTGQALADLVEDTTGVPAGSVREVCDVIADHVRAREDALARVAAEAISRVEILERLLAIEQGTDR